MKLKGTYIIMGVISLLLVLWIFLSDINPAKDTENLSDIGSQKSLAQKYCSTCHLFPAPKLLDKETWKTGVLPNMGRRLGIHTDDYDPFRDIPKEEAILIRSLDIYPEKPLLSNAEWEAIVDYYISVAPDSLSSPKNTTPVEADHPYFSPHLIDIEDNEVPQVTMLHLDYTKSELYIGEGDFLYALNSSGSFSSSWKLSHPAVDLKIGPDDKLYLLTIGEFNPTDLDIGIFTQLNKEGSTLSDNILIDHLPRPVSFTLGDLNGDGEQDVIICGFGHHQGEIAWYDNFQVKHLLNELPGARKAIVKDLNGDDQPDIMVLMAQAWEGVDIYYNKGDGQFHRNRVLEFSPIHGASYIEMTDFNTDGYQDLLITNGDNWDYSPVKKPYHGIRIYLNDGKNEFEEKFFFPMYGCSKALAHDFDEDGDLDIVAISFYDNIDQPEKSFVYLENSGSLTFSAHYIPQAANGKWLTMEAGDFNQDGLTDLFLGSYFHNIRELTKLLSNGITSFPEVLMLVNTNRGEK